MTGDPAGEAPASSLLLAGDGQQAPAARDCLVEVTVPVYNEEKILARNIRRLHSCLTGNLSFISLSPSPTTRAPTAPSPWLGS
jgi:hypothetical protein